MSTYCISDIHGKFKAFMQMLDKINFDKNKDKLYVLGDMIDWGEGSIDTVKYCMGNQDFITTLTGNHEFMMLQFLKEKPNKGRLDYHPWIKHNDGKSTLRQLNKCSEDMRKKIIDWLGKLSFYKEVEIGAQKFYLTHSYPLESTGNIEEDYETMVWRRVVGAENPLKRLGITDTILIAGHTPTKYEYYYPDADNEPFSIYQDLKNQKIMIDCAAKIMGNPNFTQNTTARLGCLRLDDLHEFYIKNP